ncbi:hypothetical protein SY83_10895 [Paenibacillus swuensis]|uniref:SbsA Ig-like domain-containing protein n=1 Tax=Paenibacillus swuensis TaxID=1178515 RepID=A0A172TI08_9BACL|nr:hypothetical protein [Paenibacillus swuensis]ANE46695.1 hypothetical protein SY83_10895 [Paenibacillus swuensis]
MFTQNMFDNMKKAVIGSAFLVTVTVASLVGAPSTADAYQPTPLENSFYPENNESGVPSQLPYVRVSFNSNPGEIIGAHTPATISIDKLDGAAEQQAKIQVIEMSTNTPVHAMLASTDVNGDGVLDPELIVTGNTLAIKVNPFDATKAVNDPNNKNRLKPGESYQVIIPQGSIVHKTGDTSKDNNKAISWTFTVERKPTPANFSFQPGNQTFKFTPGIVNTGLPNNVHAHGVGYRKTLVLEFQNGVKPNVPENTIVISGNELSPSATPHNPTTITKQDVTSSNTLNVTMPVGNPLRANHLYTVSISNTLTDEDASIVKYFNIKPTTPSPVQVKAPGTKTVAQYKSEVVAYAEQVRRYAFNAIYPYFMTTDAKVIGAGNEAAKLASLAINTSRNISLDTTTATAALLHTTYAEPLYQAIEAATTGFDAVVNANYSYAPASTQSDLISTAATNKYPLKNDPIFIRFSTFRDFKQTLVDPATATVQNINNTILSIEPPRRVGVVIPKSYIKSIQTLHYVQGLVPSSQGNNLTNIDIAADSDVDKVIITSNRGVRVLNSKVNNVWTAGYAGLEADGLNEVRIQAYDKYGQILEERNFKLAVDGTDPLKEDYLPKESKVLGKTYSLHELMEDPKLFSEVLLHFPVSKLNELGIFLPYTP